MFVLCQAYLMNLQSKLSLTLSEGSQKFSMKTGVLNNQVTFGNVTRAPRQ